MSFTVRIDEIGYLSSVDPKGTFRARDGIYESKRKKTREQAQKWRDKRRKEFYDLQKFKRDCEDILIDRKTNDQEKVLAICKMIGIPYPQPFHYTPSEPSVSDLYFPMLEV